MATLYTHNELRMFPIPNELLYHITDSLQDDIVSLKACSLVSRPWQSAARAHVLSSITIHKHDDDARSLTAFVHFLASSHSMRPLVKNLRMLAVECSVHDVYSVLLQLPQCQTLALHVCEIKPSGPGDLFPAPPFPHLVALCYVECIFLRSWHAAFQLVGLFGHITELSFQNVVKEDAFPRIAASTDPPDARSHKTSVESLKYDLATPYAREDLQKVSLQWLDLRFLLSLQIARGPSMVEQRSDQLFLDSAVALRQLRLDADQYVSTDVLGPDAPPSLKSCTKLEAITFSLRLSWRNHLVGAKLSNVGMLLKSLPQDTQLSAVRFDIIIDKDILAQNYSTHVQRLNWQPFLQCLHRISSVTHVGIACRHPKHRSMM
ncbi:hypothetical protein EIP91_001372 [Steccherinum ochraceum]|uniref:F-box domain-containing protein n=1 Tax=Steccherinum ochraceum TaxID=92696 RepID=A0A4R0RGL2_9APHY|nr:hypothetical protein EIP91_001372 [Steccherinum ochraceum]